MKLPYEVSEIARNVHTIRMDARAGFDQWFLLSADRHHDNLHARHDLEKKHLVQAVTRDAGILDFGDLSCAMQGKWDKRADQNQLREELRGNDYANRLVKYNSAFYEPYKKHIALITPGNHEHGFLKKNDYNLTQAMADVLGVRFGTYAGWVRFAFTIYGTQQQTINLYYNHGYGGGGAVTKGVIQSNRMAVYLPDASIVVSSHTHDHWLLPLGRQRISQAGVPFIDEQYHVKCGGYKDEFSGGEGWHVERGGEPKPLGAVWLRFYMEDRRMRFELSRAN